MYDTCQAPTHRAQYAVQKNGFAKANCPSHKIPSDKLLIVVYGDKLIAQYFTFGLKFERSSFSRWHRQKFFAICDIIF